MDIIFKDSNLVYWSTNQFELIQLLNLKRCPLYKGPVQNCTKGFKLAHSTRLDIFDNRPSLQNLSFEGLWLDFQ